MAGDVMDETEQAELAEMEALKQIYREEDEVCRGIGHFIHEFSQLEFTLKTHLASEARLADQYIDAVLGQMDFTKVCQALLAVTATNAGEGSEQWRQLQSIVNEAMGLNSKYRVPIAHALWTPGGPGLVARKVAGGNAKVTYHFERPGELEEATDKIRHVIAQLWFRKTTAAPAASP